MPFRARDRAVLSEGSFVSEAAEIWDHLKVHVKENIPSVEFHTWFSRVQAVGVQDGTFVLGVTSSFAADWLKQHYLPLLEERPEGQLQGLAKHPRRGARA
jgi:DnaA N-terminal domain